MSRLICPVCEREIKNHYCSLCKKMVKNPVVYKGDLLPNESANYGTLTLEDIMSKPISNQKKHISKRVSSYQDHPQQKQNTKSTAKRSGSIYHGQNSVLQYLANEFSSLNNKSRK